MNLPHILDNIIDLFKQKGDSVLGIDIGSSSIKIVQLRNKGGQAILETYGEVALGPYAEVDIGRGVKLNSDVLVGAVNDVLKESNATTKVVGMAIQLSSSLINTMKVPRINDNLEEIVAMEARRYIPVSLSEVTLDWQIIPAALNTSLSQNASLDKNLNTPEGVVIEKGEEVSKKSEIQSTSVLIVAVHTETINRLRETAEKAGLTCKFFELEAFSTIRAVINRQIKTSAIVDFGASSTKVYIVDGGIIRTSHVIPFGSQDITLAIARSTGMSIAEAERVKRTDGMTSGLGGESLAKLMEGSVSYLANETSKVITEYQTKENSIIKELVLSGGGVNVKGLSDLFITKVSVPVRVADPFSNVVAPAFLEKILKDIGPSFSVALGTALRAAGEGH